MTEIRKTEVFAKWLDSLDDIRARARILVRIERLAAGNPDAMQSRWVKGFQSCGLTTDQAIGFITNRAANLSDNPAGWWRQTYAGQGRQNSLAFGKKSI
jgi:hypothetical protein